MGEVFLDNDQGILWISSIFVLYGDAANQQLSTVMAEEVAGSWNAPRAMIRLKGFEYRVQFKIRGEYAPDISPDDIHGNLDPAMNFFRVEDFSRLHISFVDEIGCNTGYFLHENLTNGSTTAAHEYGHTLGLLHPAYLDIRGQGRPGIMYPRGTWVDAAFQWDPKVPAGTKGGTLKPHYRVVLSSDIASLGLEKLRFNRAGKAVIGDFTNLYHVKH
jgi:hypothetical protein